MTNKPININKPIIDKLNKYFDYEISKSDPLEEISIYYVKKNIMDWFEVEGLK